MTPEERLILKRLKKERQRSRQEDKKDSEEKELEQLEEDVFYEFKIGDKIVQIRVVSPNK